MLVLIKKDVHKSMILLKSLISKGSAYCNSKKNQQMGIFKKPFQNVSYLLIFFFIFLLFFSFTIFLYSNSLNNYFTHDDLHLIRVYSQDELRTVLWGNWEPDNIETPGFRPLTTYFNHIRAVLFGDSAFAHHFFLIFLSALCMSLFVILFKFFNIPYSILIIAGLLTITAKNYAFHIAWISDGIHIFQGILFTLSAIVCLIYLKNSQKYKWIFLGFSLILFLSNLLTREDSILTGPVLILLAGSYFYWILKPLKRKIKILIIYIICLLIIILIYIIWRTLANVPSASLDNPFSITGIYGMVRMFNFTILLAGFKDGFVILYFFLACVAIFLLFYIPIIDLKTNFCDKKSSFCSTLFKKYFVSYEAKKYIEIWRLSLLIFSCTLIFCSVGFLMARSNLNFFSSYFYALFIILIIYAFYLINYPYSKFFIFILCLILIMAIFIQANNNISMQSSFNEASILSISNNAWFIYETNATIPVERRIHILNYFETLGVTGSNYQGRIKEINCALLNKNFIGPTFKKPFIPNILYFEDDGFRGDFPITSCE